MMYRYSLGVESLNIKIRVARTAVKHRPPPTTLLESELEGILLRSANHTPDIYLVDMTVLRQ
jgi:hypothetical protein